MSNKIRKTEHAGAKNGGGYWGSRHEAKTVSKKIRRSQSRLLETLCAFEPRSSETADETSKENDKTN